MLIIVQHTCEGAAYCVLESSGDLHVVRTIAATKVQVSYFLVEHATWHDDACIGSHGNSVGDATNAAHGASIWDEHVFLYMYMYICICIYIYIYIYRERGR